MTEVEKLKKVIVDLCEQIAGMKVAEGDPSYVAQRTLADNAVLKAELEELKKEFHHERTDHGRFTHRILEEKQQAEGELAIAIEALKFHSDEERIFAVCDRKEHVGWYDGHGDFCLDCGGYEPRERLKEIRPNPARIALGKIGVR